MVLASSSLLAARSAQLGLRVLLLLMIAAYGREADLASASYALALAEIGRAIADFGTDLWSVRAIALAGDARQEGRIVAAVGVIKLCGCAVIGAGIYLACALKLPSGQLFGLLAIALLLASQMTGLAISYFQAKTDLRELRRMVMPCLITLAASLLAVLLSRSALSAMGALAAGELYTAATLLMLLYRSVGSTDLARLRPETAATARACVPAAAFNIVAGLSARLDTIVLAEYSLQALAAYTVAQRLFQPFLVFATSFGAIILTRTSLAIRARRPFMREFLTREMPAIVGVAIILAAVLLACGHFFLERVVPQYRPMFRPLALLCAILPLLSYNAAISGLLQGFGRYWTVLVISSLDLALMYALMSSWAPQYGPIGIVAGMLVGAAFNGIAQTFAMVVSARLNAQYEDRGRTRVAG